MPDQHETRLTVRCAKHLTQFARCAMFLHLLVCCGCGALGGGQDLSSVLSNHAVDAKTLATSQAQLAVRAAETAEQQGKPGEAIRLYEQARTLDPKWVSLSRRLAVLYDQRGDDGRAQAAYERALAVEPHDPDLLNDYGVFHLQREHWPAAESWFRRALAEEPNHQRATINLAMSLAMQNRLSESYEAFARVVSPAAAYSNLGVLLTRRGRTDEARDHFTRARAIDPSIRPAEEFLAYLNGPGTPARSDSWRGQHVATSWKPVP